MAFACSPAHAASIVVSDGGDSGSETTCTLRQAIESANKDAHGTSSCADGSGSDTITFAETLLDSTITLGGAELAVRSPLTIAGSGQTIDAGGASRVMYVGFTSLDASNISLVNGAATGNSGGGLFILQGVVSLDQVDVSGNSADYAAGIAVFNYSNLTLSQSTVSANSAARKGGAIEIVNGAGVTLNRSTVSDNSASRGGGIFVSFYSELDINQSTVSGNTATSAPPQSGGGIYGYKCGRLAVVDSTVSANTTNYRGSGIVAIECPLSLANVTVAGNVSTGSGGAVYLGHADVAIVNSTISGNSGHDVGGLLVDNGTATLANTILGGNAADGAYAATADLGQNGTGSVSAQYSLLGTALDVAQFNDGGNHNLFADDPQLGPLQDNGGPTRTMATLQGAMVVDAGSNGLAQVPGHPLTYDQRPGYPRIVNGTVDIGAYELQPDRIFAGGFEELP
jgi:predicted outer membrane repeat protein